jgi:hypothetical protein
MPIDHVIKDPLSKLLWLHTFGEPKGLKERVKGLVTYSVFIV